MKINLPIGTSDLSRRTIRFAIYAGICAVVFLGPLRDLFRVSLSSDTYSHLFVIPVIVAGLLYAEQGRIFREVGDGSRLAVGFFQLGVLVFAFDRLSASLVGAEVSLDLAIVSLLLFVWAGFSWFYGCQAFGAGVFPLFSLLLMLPPPAAFLDRCIVWLQWGSAAVTEWIFTLTGTPFSRDGLIFALPGVAIEIAAECSGIRSTIALLITCLAASYILLRTGWARAALLLAALPVVLLKNGIRIATLSLLAIHVSPSFLYGRLHRDGGVVFFVIGMVFLLPVLWWLQSLEKKWGGRQGRAQGTAKIKDETMPAPSGN